jgi:hypothetical protein
MPALVSLLPTDATASEAQSRIPADQEDVIRAIAGAREAALREILSSVRPGTQTDGPNSLAYADVIEEVPLPTMGTLGRALAALLAPSRPLRPTRRPRKPAALATLATTDCRLVVRVIRAFDVPVRVAAQSTNSEPLPDVTALVHPFVQVEFQRNTASTRVATGPSPVWHEELVLPFVPPSDEHTAEALLRCNDFIFLNLYDEILVELRGNSTETGEVSKRRRLKRWLGTCSVPLTSLYANQELDGTFRVDVPMTLLGYTRTGRGGLGGFAAAKHTYLRVFVTLDPPLRLPPPVSVAINSIEDPALLAYATHWVTDLQARGPSGAALFVTVNDINGVCMCVTRFIHSQAPPAELLDADHVTVSMARVARFVASIPCVQDAAAFQSNVDRWCTSGQFLHMLAGDNEEHAVLLCNFFLALGIESFCVQGQAVPDGASVFVMTRAQDETRLWDPVRAQVYELSDGFCPLQRIGVIFNEHNVWGNLQPSGVPSQMSFELSHPRHWRPLFSPSYPHPGLTSVQVDNLQVGQASALAGPLAVALENMLTSRVELWRDMVVTRWHRHATAVLRETLAGFEDAAVHTIAQEITASQIDLAAMAAAALVQAGDARPNPGLPLAVAPATSGALGGAMVDAGTLGAHIGVHSLGANPIAQAPTSINAQSGVQMRPSAHAQAAQDLLRPPPLAALETAYEITGYPMCIAYTTPQRVIDMVHSSGLHATAGADSELALAVHVHAYPGGAMTVWVYFAELVPRQ